MIRVSFRDTISAGEDVLTATKPKKKEKEKKQSERQRCRCKIHKHKQRLRGLQRKSQTEPPVDWNENWPKKQTTKKNKNKNSPSQRNVAARGLGAPRLVHFMHLQFSSEKKKKKNKAVRYWIKPLANLFLPVSFFFLFSVWEFKQSGFKPEKKGGNGKKSSDTFGETNLSNSNKQARYTLLDKQKCCREPPHEGKKIEKKRKKNPPLVCAWVQRRTSSSTSRRK